MAVCHRGCDAAVNARLRGLADGPSDVAGECTFVLGAVRRREVGAGECPALRPNRIRKIAGLRVRCGENRHQSSRTLYDAEAKGQY
jgi:hypothetical protein